MYYWSRNNNIIKTDLYNKLYREKQKEKKKISDQNKRMKAMVGHKSILNSIDKYQIKKTTTDL